jgi:xylulokinase
MLPKDYIRYRLTGGGSSGEDGLGTEPSDACSTLLFDTAHRCWSTALLDALEIDPDLLPPVHESAGVAGGLSHEIASSTGMRAGTPVVYGGGDQAVQALGNGVLEPGVVSCTIGTGGQLLAPIATRETHGASNPVYDPSLRLHLFCHAVPDCWYLLAATLSAGLTLKWLRDRIFENQSYRALADMAGDVPPGAEGLFFLPHLAGERTPHMDPRAQGAYVGLTLRHHRGHLVRAAMEGVVFALRQGFDLMGELGVVVERVVASGGGARHPLWLQLQADILNRPIYQTQTVEAAAAGAALLAGVGVGVYPDARSACRQSVRCGKKVVRPDPEKVARYAEAYQTYGALYPALKWMGDRTKEQ